MLEMLDTLRSSLKVSELRRKLMFTLAMLFVFRLGVAISVPGVNPQVIANLISQGQLFGFFNIISGGAFKNFSVFAMGIIPYINASIIMQLFTVVIPALEKLAKEGAEGQKKITQYTRYATVGLSLIQAMGMAVGLRSALYTPNIWNYLFVALALTAGSTFLMWVGEQITEKGIGNGISLLIFAAIVSRIPSGAVRMYQYIAAGTIGVWSILGLAVIAAVVIAGIILVQQGERRIPVQYAKRVVGRRIYGGQSSHIPLKVNQAGVIPVIFAASIMFLPQALGGWFKGNPAVDWINSALRWGGPAQTILYVVLVIGFTYFYTAVIMNPVDVADNIKKYGGFIPGYRPGRPTAEYIGRVLSRITLAGAVFLAAIAVLPNFVLVATKIPNVYFGGTALLIVVGVALDTMKQVESHLLMRSYQGFIK